MEAEEVHHGPRRPLVSFQAQVRVHGPREVALAGHDGVQEHAHLFVGHGHAAIEFGEELLTASTAAGRRGVARRAHHAVAHRRDTLLRDGARAEDGKLDVRRRG